ncbi:hypothetical protein FNU79_10790 [Deinococcus detaillensis]|uniref:Uncharacterized protein n=1 Tax=Deinococcus detaillensis TaxID=2592048 RepID=A0A553UW73_9DEIO|nr:hypothetical protein [Deinococcus detaillensis]TSA84449.1 hypothetical protein FNU79_10790 [Deinococcus detaillensis]
MSPSHSLLLATSSLTAALLTTGLAAEVRVPDSKVSYEVSQDAKKQNNSVIYLDERYTDTSKSYLSLRCIGGGYLASLSSKYALFDKGQRNDLDKLYRVMYQVGSAGPLAVKTLRSYEVAGKLDLSAFTFLDPAANAAIAAGLTAGKTLRLQLKPLKTGVLTEPLNYTFEAQGFGAAATAVNQCH